MDSLQPFSREDYSFYTSPRRNEDRDKVDNEQYFSSLTSTQVTKLIDLINLFVAVDLDGPKVMVGTQKLIGEGAQFRVYKAIIVHCEGNDQEYYVVAIKKPRFFLEANVDLDLSTPKARRQLHDIHLEILVLRHPMLVEHPNIVKLLFWGHENLTYHSQPFLVQELALSDLKTFLQSKSNGAKNSWSTNYHLCLDVGAGLDALHRLEIVHGDLKPENVLVFDQGGLVAKLSDFGMSLLDTYCGETLRGTPGWQAPEVHSVVSVHPPNYLKADNYTFGLVIWSTLFLDGMQVSTHALENREAVLRKSTQKLTTFHNSSQTVTRAILQLLQVDPDDRPHLVSNLLDDGSSLYKQW